MNIFNTFGARPKYENMEDSFSKAENIIQDTKNYINNRIALFKLEIAEKTSAIISNAITFSISLFFFFVFLIFAGCGLALYFGKLTGEIYLGFIIVSIIYLLAGIFIKKIAGKSIRMRIMNSILKQFFSEED
jgi:hypothetical protein